MTGKTSEEKDLATGLPTIAPTEGADGSKPESVMPAEDWLDEGLLETFPASDPLASGRIA